MGYLVQFIYGVVILTILYFFVRMLYSVYYTPGSTVLYNSPVTQQLFPNAMNKMFPSWGYNSQGMLKGDTTKYGQGDFWPEAGQGYKPNKYGSPGASPSGGLRPSFRIPNETEVGFWGQVYEPEQNVQLDIYDNSTQHVEYETPVGWWND
jgi:hypothetical protein